MLVVSTDHVDIVPVFTAVEVVMWKLNLRKIVFVFFSLITLISLSSCNFIQGNFSNSKNRKSIGGIKRHYPAHTYQSKNKRSKVRTNKLAKSSNKKIKKQPRYKSGKKRHRR